LKQTRTIGKQLGRAELKPETFNADDNTIDVVFATEVSVLRQTWDGLYQEILVCQTDNVRLDRLNSGGAVIDSHNTWTIKNQFGVVARAWVDNATKEAKATLKLSKQKDWEGVVADIKAGIIRNISVGYNIYVFEVDDSNPNAAPIYRAIDWEPCEISFTPVPADYMSGTRSENSVKNSVTINFKMKRKNTEIAEIVTACRAAGLTTEYADLLVNCELAHEAVLAEIASKRTAPATPAPASKPVDTPAQPAIDPVAVRTEERTRIAGIRTAARIAGVDEAFATGLIDNGTALADARALIIDKAAEANPVKPVLNAAVTGADVKDKKARGMEAALTQRAGAVKLETGADPGEFRGMTLMDMAKECLTEGGVNYRGMSQREIATRALTMGARDGGGLATGDFSFVLQNVLNKTLRTAYDLKERTFTPWTRKSTATDFKPILRAQLNDLKLTGVAESGEYKYAQSGDTGETYKLSKYGRIVRISWEAIVNDDLDAFSRFPGMLAGAVAQMQSDVVYGIVNTNPAMADGIALFNQAKHFNFTTAGTDITLASLGIARQAIRTQKSPAGSQLNLTPKFLICGPNKEQVALQFLSANFTATQSGTINVFAGTMTPIIEGRITDDRWFLSADPGSIDTIEYSTLEGQDIYTESRYGFEVDALEWKVRSAFGAKAIEYRGLYENEGA
jgi:hypothetical protein